MSEFKESLNPNRAQSTVIGAILLIVVTIILVSFVAVYVFDVGGSLEGSAPQASFTFENTTDGLRATHDGGQSVAAENIEIVVFDDGVAPRAYPEGGAAPTGTEESTVRTSGTAIFGDVDIEVGDSTIVAHSVGEGDEVRIVYIDPDSDQGTTLARYEG